MKLSELKEFSSVKFEYKGYKERDYAPMVFKGMFYKLNRPNSEKPSYFFGYIEGMGKDWLYPRVYRVRLVNTDKKSTESLHRCYIHSSGGREFDVGQYTDIGMNINNMSGTRMKKEVSDYIKKVGKVKRKEYDIEDEIDRLKEKQLTIYRNFSDEDRDKRGNIRDIIVEDINKRPTPNIKTLKGMALLEELEKLTNKEDNVGNIESDGKVFKLEVADRNMIENLPIYVGYNGESIEKNTDDITLLKLMLRNDKRKLDKILAVNKLAKENKEIKTDLSLYTHDRDRFNGTYYAMLKVPNKVTKETAKKYIELNKKLISIFRCN